MSDEPLPTGDRLRLFDPDRVEVRGHSIQDGDVIAFHRRGFWSAMIRCWTSSRISHVGFALWIGSHLCVLEAQEGRGVQIVSMSSYRADTNVRAFWYRLRTESYPTLKRGDLVDEALGHLGCRYASPWQFLRSWGLVTEPLCDFFGLSKDLDPQRFFCSEFILGRLRARGYKDNPEFDAPRASPGDVIELDCLEDMGQVSPRRCDASGRGGKPLWAA